MADFKCPMAQLELGKRPCANEWSASWDLTNLAEVQVEKEALRIKLAQTLKNS